MNEAGLVFGFHLTYATVPGDSQKLFMERLDFAVQQYPNHIDFPQTENGADGDSLYEAKVTGTFSANDIRYCRDTAFACRTFYTAGRAVPWFLSILKPLRIYPSRFFSDFASILNFFKYLFDISCNFFSRFFLYLDGNSGNFVFSFFISIFLLSISTTKIESSKINLWNLKNCS